MEFVYALVDEDADDEVGYVGITDDPNARLRQHLDMTDTNVYKNAWIGERLARGARLGMKLLQVCNSRQEAEESEYTWIQYFAEHGSSLKNIHKTGGLFVREEDLLVDTAGADLAMAVLFVLESELYGIDATVHFTEVVPSWAKGYGLHWRDGDLANPPLYWYLAQDRHLSKTSVWASLCLLPLEKELIFRLL
jgi:predicted GIY-YIG superfamily endonuclease